jgi:hypothetical protein
VPARSERRRYVTVCPLVRAPYASATEQRSNMASRVPALRGFWAAFGLPRTLRAHWMLSATFLDCCTGCRIHSWCAPKPFVPEFERLAGAPCQEPIQGHLILVIRMRVEDIPSPRMFAAGPVRARGIAKRLSCACREKLLMRNVANWSRCRRRDIGSAKARRWIG